MWSPHGSLNKLTEHQGVKKQLDQDADQLGVFVCVWGVGGRLGGRGGALQIAAVVMRLRRGGGECQHVHGGRMEQRVHGGRMEQRVHGGRMGQRMHGRR